MGLKWNPDFDRKEHKSEVKSPQGRQALMQKAGAVKYLKRIKRPTMKAAEGKSRWNLNAKAREVERDFVQPGSLVRIVLSRQKYYGGHGYCTVVSEREGYSPTRETLDWGK